jgi:hypothetical protein
MYKYLLLLTLCFFFPLVTFAQTTKTSLSGRVTTGNGEVMNGVSLVVTYLPAGTIYGCATNATGNYLIPDLKPGGPYQIELSSVGYKKQLISAVFLKLDEPLVINITLESLINSLPEVKIINRQPGIKLRSANSGPIFNITKTAIDLLPTVKRGVWDFVKISPQAFGTAIAGGNYRQNFITIDGSEFNNNFGVGENLPGNGAQPVSLDAIAEISVNIAPYNSIWESGFIGSAVNMISRSGSNKTEGSVYTYFRNQDNYGYKAGGLNLEKRALGYHMEGFRLGGPLILNKLFYFLSFEQENERYQPQNLSAATTAMPYGSTPNVARPTATELNDISSFLAATYGYDTGPYQGYDFINESNRMLLRLDWNIAENNNFSIRYNQLHSSRPELVNGSRSPLTPYAVSFGRRTPNALPFSNSNFTTLSNFYSLSAEWNKRISRVVTNTARASYTRQYEPRTSNSEIFPFVDILKDGTPFTSFGYEPYTYGNNRDVSVFSLADHVNWTHHNNTWTAGFQTDYSKTKNSYMPFGTSYYTYASWDDFTSGKKPVDYAATYSLNETAGYPEYSFDYLNISAFIQQNIVIDDKLSLTTGLRMDLPLFPQALPQNEALAKLSFSGGQHINTSVLPDPALLFSPRLAFQYNFRSDRSLRLRGGTGIFTGRIPFVWIISQARYSGMYQLTQTLQGQQNTPGTFNPVVQAPHIPGENGSLPAITSALSRDFKMPQTWKSSIGLDIKLPAGFTAIFDVIYNRDIRAILFKDVNLVDPVPLNIAGYPDNRLVYPAGNSKKFINPINMAGMPDPNGSSALNAVVVTNSSRGYYLSATAQIEKKINSRFNFSMAYSRNTARNYNDGDGDQTLSALNATPTVNGINQPGLGYAGYIPPDRVIAVLGYTQQYGKNARFSIGLIYQGANEGRFSYTYAKDFIRDGTNKSLIYVPANPSEIRFEPLTVTAGGKTITYSSQQQSDAFFNYIAQDGYLKHRKGKYAERNGGLLPWRQQFDLRLSHDLFLEKKNRKHILQLTCDILNAGNLINRNWGLKKLVNTSSLLVPVNLEAVKPGGTVWPAFQLATVGEQLATTTFRNDYSLNSTYMMQFGIRYLFE